MIQAIVRDSMTFWFACGGLQREYDVAIAAFGSSFGCELIGRLLSSIEDLEDSDFIHGTC
jgi:hypothetical protein